jgi:hypothetical protein
MGLDKDFFEELECVCKDGLIKGKYIIYEKNNEGTHRISHVDSASGAVYREERF